MLIFVSNDLTISSPKTYLSTNVSAGGSVLPWRSPAITNASWAIQIGNTSEATSEIVILGTATPSGTAGTITGTVAYDHPADTPIFGIKYNQIVVERSTAGTAGTATPLTGGTISIQSTGTLTYYDDTSGAVGYAYKTYFRNSVLAVNSSESDWITTGGFPFYSLGKMKQRVKDKLVSSGYISGINVDDSMISDWINEWLEQMQSSAIDVNEDYNLGTMAISYAANVELGTVTATDFRGGLTRAWLTDSSGTYIAKKEDSNSFSPNGVFSSTYPLFYMQGDSVIGRRPFDSAGTLVCEYPKLNTLLTSDDDVLPITMQGYTKSFIDYAHSQALFKDQKIQEAQAKLTEALTMKERFMKEITPRNRTSATYIDMVEMGSDEVW